MRDLNNPLSLLVELEALDSVIVALRDENARLRATVMETSDRAYKRATDLETYEAELEKARTIGWVADDAVPSKAVKKYTTVDDLAKAQGMIV